MPRHPRSCRLCGNPVEPPTPAEANRFRRRGADVCLGCDAALFPAPAPVRSYQPRCTCGTALKLEVGPGLHQAVVVSSYCPDCHKLTMPYRGRLPRELRAQVERLRDEQRPAAAPSAATAA